MASVSLHTPIFTFASSQINQLEALRTQTLVSNFQVIACVTAATIIVQAFICSFKEKADHETTLEVSNFQAFLVLG